MNRTLKVALLAGVSVIALSSAAMAQSTWVPFQNDESATALTVPGGATAPGTPYVNAPGATPTTIGAYELTSPNGIDTTIAQSKVVDSHGNSIVTYGNELAATGAFVGTGTGTNGQYLLDTAGHIVSAATVAANGSNFDASGACTANCGTYKNTGALTGFVAPTAHDSLAVWTPVSYSMETAASTAATHSQIAGIAANSYLIDGNGKLVSTSAATAAGLTATSSATDIAAAGFTQVLQGTIDQKATAASVASTDYAFTKVAAVAVVGNSQTIAGPGSLVQQNTDSTGKVTNSTAIGPNGIAIADTVTGNTSTLTPGKLTLGYGGVPGVGITLDATVDPVLTVSGGTPATTTTISNGDVTAGNSLKVGTGANTTTISGGNVTTTGTVTAAKVSAPVISTQDSTGTVYGNVGNTLTSYGNTLTTDGAAIKALNGEVANAQSTANKALNSAAIVAAMPQLHFAPSDWLSVGVGGADAQGTGAWALAAGALIRPNVMLGVKGGMSGNTGVVAASGSISFGGNSVPLK